MILLSGPARWWRDAGDERVRQDRTGLVAARTAQGRVAAPELLRVPHAAENLDSHFGGRDTALGGWSRTR